jgi:hypothetical protein
VELVDRAEEGRVGSVPAGRVGPVLCAQDLVVGEPDPLCDANVLAPLVVAATVPCGAQDDQLAVATGQRAVQQAVEEGRPSGEQRAMSYQRAQDVRASGRRRPVDHDRRQERARLVVELVIGEWFDARCTSGHGVPRQSAGALGS